MKSEPEENLITESGWARGAALAIIGQFDDATCIETANYQLCGFILAAAKIAAENQDFAAKIGARMEPARPYVTLALREGFGS